MKAVIDFVCNAHTIADERGPLITPVEGVWGYCAGRAQEGHDWTRIEPARREVLEDVSQMQERRAS